MTPQHEQLVSDALALELEQLLAPTPSSGFEARIRARVAAEEPSRATWFHSWWALAGGAAVLVSVVIAAVSLGTSTGSGDGVVVPSPDGRSAHASNLIADDAAAPVVAVATASRRRAVPLPDSASHGATVIDVFTPFVESTAPALVMPDVVIGAGERRALALVLHLRAPAERDGARTSRSPASAIAQGGETVQPVTLAELPDPGHIELVAIDVQPLAPIARLQGDRP